MEPLEVARAGTVVGGACLATTALLSPGAWRWLPERACQVPGYLPLRLGRERAAMWWGLELGFGFCTFIVTPAIYAMVAVALGQEHPLSGSLVCAAYGAARGLTIAVFALWDAPRDDTGEQMPTGRLRNALKVPLLITIAASTGSLLT